MKLIWNPPDQSGLLAQYQQDLATYRDDLSRQAHAAFVQSVADRVTLASKVPPRLADDMRSEERAILFRRLIRQLTQAPPDQPLHVTSELVETIFDMDSMLYFVSPEWWMPRPAYHQDVGSIDGRPVWPTPQAQATPPPTGGPSGSVTTVAQPTTQTSGQPGVLSQGDVITWGGANDPGRDNYLITDESLPAPLGSSLGWLIQLDGDDRRNAFLNAPWVKAVLPVKPGKEVEAITWLEQEHVEGTENLDATYAGDPIPGLAANATILDALNDLIRQIRQENLDTAGQLTTERAFEDGFDPLAIPGAVRFPGNSFEVFDRWLEILPTDQVVATEYAP